MSNTVHIPFDERRARRSSDVMMLEPRSVGPDTPIAEIRETFSSPSREADARHRRRTLPRHASPATTCPESGDGPIEPHVRTDTPSLRPDDPVDKRAGARSASTS